MSPVGRVFRSEVQDPGAVESMQYAAECSRELVNLLSAEPIRKCMQEEMWVTLYLTSLDLCRGLELSIEGSSVLGSEQVKNK